jgi:lipopolysaccharide biosynthesis protein
MFDYPENALMNNEHFKIQYVNDILTLRIKDEYDYSMQVPSYVPDNFTFTAPIAAIIHIYYTELTPEIISYINHIPTRTDLYISTDSEAKKTEIERCLTGYAKGCVCVRVFQNCGRDIAPTYIGFRDVFDNYEYFVHLHGKKSLHQDKLSDWRTYLFETLVGSNDIVSSILWQLSQPDIGVVFAQHFEKIRDWVNWGELDYPTVKSLLSKSRIDIDFTNYLDFPSSSMFWAKTAAVKPLLDINLAWSDFPEELGQCAGTLAHAIERSILFYAEHANYEWVKVAIPDLLSFNRNILKYNNREEFNRARKAVFIPVLAKYPEIFVALQVEKYLEQQELINGLQCELNVLNANKKQFHQIHTSHSWKLTKPLHKIMRLFKK